mmetsp:Transcript_15929/g.62246  ORF Transcript_15929/g.62246 Transcript_15929/m.62246 type:complete len:407 (+) Transcript_15929:195-1415(+)
MCSSSAGVGHRRRVLLASACRGMSVHLPAACDLQDPARLCEALHGMEGEGWRAEEARLAASRLLHSLLRAEDFAAADTLILARGIDLELKDSCGHTALHAAAGVGAWRQLVAIAGRVPPATLLWVGLEVDCAVGACAFEGETAVLQQLLQLLESESAEARAKARALALAEAARGGRTRMLDWLLHEAEQRPVEGVVRQALKSALDAAESQTAAVEALLPRLPASALLDVGLQERVCMLQRAASRADGSSIGLLVARLVADQAATFGPYEEPLATLLVRAPWSTGDVADIVKPVVDLMEPSSLALQCSRLGDTPLIVAVKKGSVALVQVLVNKMEASALEIADVLGKTALIHAVASDSVEVASMLLPLMTSAGKSHRDAGEKAAEDYCSSAAMRKLPLAPAAKSAVI